AAKMTDPQSPFAGQVVQRRIAPAKRLQADPGVALGELHTSVTTFGSAPVFALVISANPGAPTLTSGEEALPVSARARAIARAGHGAYYKDVRVRGAHLRMFVTALGNGYAVVLARSLSEVDGALGLLAWGLGITCLVGILLAAVVGAAVA